MYGRGRGWSPRTPSPFNRVAANRDGDILRGAALQEGTKTPSSLNDDNNITKPQPQSHDPFDICPRPLPTKQTAPTVVLKPSLLVTNRERRKQAAEGGGTGTHSHPLVVTLRPGMILLKKYISVSEQVTIVEKCRELGRGSGGFYQPGYGDEEGEGAKLRLKMMCLGKHWDPLSTHYTDHRPSDGAKPPEIPPEFHRFVREAMAHADTLHPITPDICIVNFYSQNGRLGLHQVATFYLYL
ncbi:hypothetical protein PIB30_024474 [Stylosanthes scabra]|uniref:Alpha-ketoglutarate-dependent dioxygenase AlkB-like domain-containing protein n=1 Tax=Stylosanthes scabra TaxID=79078 RepID=A0ABU6Y827_9FABA|nr:hypothetical protein [Stylosanthes scabra]